MSRAFQHLRRFRDRGDRGDSLIIVMLIGVLITVMMITASTTLVSVIGPTKASMDSGAATAAAEAGLEDFLSYINQNCYKAFNCKSVLDAHPTSGVGFTTVPSPTNDSRASFQWTVLISSDSAARVKSVGRVAVNAAATNFITVTLVADVNQTPDFADFQYYTKYETLSQDYLTHLYANRSIAVTSNNLSGYQMPDDTRGVLTWGPGLTTAQTKICEDKFYPNPDGPGRGTTGAYPTNTPPAGIDPTSDYSWYTEGGAGDFFQPGAFSGSSFTASGSKTSVNHYDVCDTSFGAGMIYNGPIYSQDAFAVNTEDKATTCKNNQTQNPNFNNSAFSLWDGKINGAADAFAANNNPASPTQGWFRTYASYGAPPAIKNQGQPAGSQCDKFPQITTDVLELPDNTSEALSLGPCIFTGPTRVFVSGSVAYVTSPETDPNNPPCADKVVSTNNGFTNASADSNAGGLVNYALDLTKKPVIYVKTPVVTDGSGKQIVGPHPYASSGNRIFKLTTSPISPTLAPTDNITWSGNNGVATGCSPVKPSSSRQAAFDCAAMLTPTSSLDVLGTIKSAMDAQLAAVGNSPANPDPSTSTIDAAIRAVVNTAAVPAAANEPTTMVKGQSFYRLVVSQDTGNPDAAVTGSFPSMNDPFFQFKAGSAPYTQKTMGYKLSLKLVTCLNGSGAANSCRNPSEYDVGPELLVQTTEAQRYSFVPGAIVSPTYSFPWFYDSTDSSCAAPSAYTSPCQDITPYTMNYGDVYVQGQLDGSLPIVAEHDIVFTDRVWYANSDITTTNDAYSFVAGHNLRIYRPLRCTSDDPSGNTGYIVSGSNIGLGWCPNDVSGADATPYTTWSNVYEPATFYQHMNAPSLPTDTAYGADSHHIYGAMFSLGAIDPETCPAVTGDTTQPCRHVGGSFLVDNAGKGPADGKMSGGSTPPLIIEGGLYQYHRGITMLDYENHPGGSNIERPGLALQYNYDNMRIGQNPKAGFRVWFPRPRNATATSSTWRYISISTGS